MITKSKLSTDRNHRNINQSTSILQSHNQDDQDHDGLTHSSSLLFPIGSNIWVKYLSESGKEIYHDAKVMSEPTTIPNNENRNTNISIICVQWNTQKTKEWVDMRQCSLMAQTSRLRNRQRSTNRNGTANSVSTIQHHNQDASYTRRRNARNHAAFAAHGKGKVNNILCYTEYTEHSSGLPNGWRVEYVRRKITKETGKTGQVGMTGDRYWYTNTNKKLRSRIEVEMFLCLLEGNDGNEELTWKLFRSLRKNRDLWEKVKKIVAV